MHVDVATVRVVTFSLLVDDSSVRTDLPDVFRREWTRLAAPGTWWSGSERVRLAEAARAARRNGVRAQSGSAAKDVAGRISAEPQALRRAWVDTVAASVGVAAYVEIVGLVARLSAVDTFHRALGLPEPPLPEPVAGEPRRTPPPAEARSGKAWVPMVGGASIVQALSLVPAEVAAQDDLHGPLYLTIEQMADPDVTRGLHRSQMELVAARTSAVNECFY